MPDDPHELRSVSQKEDYATWLLEGVGRNLRASLSTFKFLGWVIVVLLALILWRLW